MKNKKGFTLVELLGVVVIMAVILTIVLISLSKIRDNVNKTAWENIKSEVETAAKEFLLANEHYKTDCSSGNCDVIVSVGTLVNEDYLNKVSDAKGNTVSECDIVWLHNNDGKITSTYFEYDNLKENIEENIYSELNSFLDADCKMKDSSIVTLSIDSISPPENPTPPTCEGDECCEGEECPCVGDACKTPGPNQPPDPACPSFTYSNSPIKEKWYNQDINVSFSLNPGTKYYSNLYLLTKDGKWGVIGTESKLFTQNNDTSSKHIKIDKEGEVKSILHIEEGNKKLDCPTDIFWIDKTKPTVSINGIPSGETSSNIQFTITASDTLSGIKSIQYSFDNKKWENYKAGSKINLLTNTGVKTVYAKATDKAGNTSNIVSKTGKCDKDKVYVEPEELGGRYFVLKFSSFYKSYPTKKHEYAYWDAVSTNDTTNNYNGKVSDRCGSSPPKGSLHYTPDGTTGNLYMKYKKQYYCFAVRPYRATEINGLNRWTIQYKHAMTSYNVNSSSYNGFK